jgi:E3 ubiquitin-protein ligase RNF14
MFDEIWTEMQGQEVVYRWVDWLNSSSWACISMDDNIILAPDTTTDVADERATCISMDDNIILAPDTTTDVADERAIARRQLVDFTILLMQSYSEKRSHEIFLQSLHECKVCLSENTGNSQCFFDLYDLCSYVVVPFL